MNTAKHVNDNITYLWLLTSKFKRKNPKWPRNSPSYEQATKWLSKCKLKLFFICGTELLNLFILYDFGDRKNIPDVNCSSPELKFIVKSKMDVISHIYYYNIVVILNTKHIKAFYLYFAVTILNLKVKYR